ncbi:SAICAR synthase-like protein [Parathielavia appendiculata]|uniref:Kinase n=1 Tax=Parathielavia appendiculata TaxID=2587402 RepID=A0AAN6Z1X5_9PEZI|nr:SAICAR synthase-like protein [Parathielavia appendiculata]
MLSATTTSTTVASPVYGRLDLGEVNSMLSSHREFLTRTKARTGSIEATNRERPGRRSTYCSEKTGVNPQASLILTDSPVALHDGAVEQSVLTNGRPQPRVWKTDQRVSVAPEKAWSIGSGDSANREDGQVEKSISDVLAGVEHNNRSRKASHSLRFFKEGLPEEKGKRKENRYPHPTREKSPARGEKLADIQEQSVGGEAVKTQSDEDGASVAERRDRARSVPYQTPEAKAVQGSPEDYFAPKYGQHIQTVDGESLVSPRKEVIQKRQELEPLEPLEPSGRAKLRRVSDLSVEGRESAEEGEESGEEKISSALFVPHQAPEETQEEVPMSRVPQRSVVPSRRHSRHDDFHPWLVKADEPELDQSRESLDLESEKNGPEAAEYPLVAPEVASEQVDESAPVDQREVAAASSRLSRPVSQYHEDALHDHQMTPKQPLDAIELIPYKHQVGGHTTLWRFSRRAVCKQLNNRENEFYEKIEKYHRDLLAFLPRYIGVLNVTFQKQPRRKSTMKRDEAAASDRSQAGLNGSSAHPKSNETAQGDTTQPSESQTTEAPRVVSQSMQSSSGQVPTVTFVDNQHILPRSLLQPTGNIPGLLGRYRSASASAREMALNGQDGQCAGGREEHSRPNLQDRHANSWGYTTVNKKLRNEVFNDAFLNKPIAIHRHRKGHERVARRTLQQTLRPSGSDPTLIESHERRSQSAGPAGQPPAKLNGGFHAHTQSDIGEASMLCVDDEDAPKDVTGTSAPEPQILRDSSPAQKKKRRYSGAGLRRKPKDVRDGRGDLQYFEEADDAGYKGDREDSTPVVEVFQTSPEREPARENRPAEVRDVTPAPPVGPLPFGKIPRPVNPKEAQTQRDSRVEYFLLLEDLTAGMKRPCIMDLKMGTRQYGVDANPKKQKSQQGKCAKTTSRELGVRLCGLQVWDVKTQSYVFKDKYYGRELKKGAEFQAALTRFLYDGVDRASILRHVPTVLQKLDQLEVIIKRLRGYRFYAASLLMFYDGDAGEDKENNNNNNNSSSYNSSSNNGNHNQQQHNYIDDSTTDFATDTEDLATTPSSRAARARRSRREIDFKMADFANCVTAGDLSARDRPCPPRHPDEPDNGFLRGLRSLRKYFLRIQRDTRAEMGLVCHSHHPQQQGRNGNGNGGEMAGFDGDGGVDIDDDEVDEGSVSE